jgi:hypothetical protein
MPYHAKNMSNSVKVKMNNVPKSIWHHNHGSYFMTTVIKYPKQTAVKTQESTVPPEAKIPQRWRQQKLELMKILHENCHILDSRTEWNVSFMHILLKKTFNTLQTAHIN